MNKIYIILLVLLVAYFCYKNKTQEKFQTISDAFKIPNKRCTAIYGNYHPKCMPSSRMKHVGYFKFNTIKYPLLDLNRGDMVNRYVMLKNRFAKLPQRHWNRGYYFRFPFQYHKTIPFSVVFHYIYRGTMENTYSKKKFYVFGKTLDSKMYSYILFREKDNLLQYAYKLPYRSKLKNGDATYIRNKISTYGPFIFSKD